METVLHVFFGALFAFLAERLVHWSQRNARRKSIWEQFKKLRGNISFAISRSMTSEKTPAIRECDEIIKQKIIQQCHWSDEPEILPMMAPGKKLEDLNSNIFIIGSTKYNEYADLVQREFETQMEFVWDLYAGEPDSRLLKIVTRHGEEYVATENLKADTGEHSVDYALFFHAVLKTGKQVFWLGGIHGPSTVGVWKALFESPELFASAGNAKAGEARTWFFRVTYGNVPRKEDREKISNIVQVDTLGTFKANTRPIPQYRPKALVFDLGNVLLLFDRTRTYRAIGFRLGCEWTQVRLAMEGATDLRLRYERGEIQSEDFRRQIAAVLGVDESRLPMEVFKELWGDIFFLNRKMLEVLRNLEKSREFVLVLLSSTNELHFQHVTNNFPDLLSPFANRLVLSHREHCDKDTHEIFRRAVKAAGADLSPQECVYIDDTPKHIRMANEIGMRGIVYFKYPQLVVTLREMGVYLP